MEIGIVALIFVFLLPGLVLVYCIYSAQKWAFKCFKELQKLNKHFESARK